MFWAYEDPKFIFNKIDPLQYELEFRIRRTFIENEINYQFSLTDVTKAIKVEKKNIINLCKSNFLEKIAHEIRNPLCSIMELSEEIDSKVNEIEKETNTVMELHQTKEINLSTKYIRNISNLMHYIIQDFSICSKINEFCCEDCDYKDTKNRRLSSPNEKSNPNFENSKDACVICLTKSKCDNCKTCFNCNELLKNQQFNFISKINDCVEVFKTKNEVDGKKTLNYNISNLEQGESPIIVNNLDFFNSIIFNILYYIYNCNILMDNIYFIFDTSRVNLEEYLNIEVTNTYDYVRFNLCKNDNTLTFEKYINQCRVTENYERYIHLYNAYILALQIGSTTMHINSNEFGISFKFQVIKLGKRFSDRKRFSQYDLVKNKKYKFTENYMKIKKNLIDSSQENFKSKIFKNQSIDSYFSRSLPASTKSKSHQSLNNQLTRDEISEFTNELFKNKDTPLKKQLVYRGSKIYSHKNIIEEMINQTYEDDSDNESINETHIINIEASEKSNKSHLSQSQQITRRFNSYTFLDRVVVGLLSLFENTSLIIPSILANASEDIRPFSRIRSDSSKNLKYFFKKKDRYSSNEMKLKSVPNIPVITNMANMGNMGNSRNHQPMLSLQNIPTIQTLIFKDYTQNPHNPKSIRILIVDDERLIRNTMQRFISKVAIEENLNFESLDCENGFEALDFVYKASKYKTPINIIITDETMPFMKGSTLINIVSSSIKEGTIERCKLISYTSYNTEEKRSWILSQGADLMKVKPIA